MSEVESMRRIAERLFVPLAVQAYGEPGGRCVRTLLETLRAIYRVAPAESLVEGLVVFSPIDPDARPFRAGEERLIEVDAIDGLPPVPFVQTVGGRRALVWDSQPDPAVLCTEGIVYALRPDHEGFWFPAGFELLENPFGYPSALAPPTFFLLEDALEYYGHQAARRTTCKLLSAVWETDDRLFLANKPEAVMRGSLAQHLRVVLRDHAEVFEEQNVSETEPIDIKVTFYDAQHRGLIEIKWLGRSVNASGSGQGINFWAPSRTNAGAKQLADYIDNHATRSRDTRVVGHLVVFDARREGMTGYPAEVTAYQAWAYEHADFELDGAYAARPDFGRAFRYFMEPAIARPVA